MSFTTSLVQFSRSVVSYSLRSRGLQRARLPCPSPTPKACSNSCQSNRWYHPTNSLFPWVLCFQRLKGMEKNPEWHEQTLDMYSILLLFSHQVMSDSLATPWIVARQAPLLEKEMATHSSVLAWRIPGTREPGGLLSMGSHRVGHDWSNLVAAAAAAAGSSVLGKNTRVHCYCFLQGIFLTQGLNPHLLHWQVDALPLSHQGSSTFNRRDNTQ